MSPVLATAAATKATVPRVTEQAVSAGRRLIDVIVDRDLRIGGEIESGAVIEGDAELEFADVSAACR